MPTRKGSIRLFQLAGITVYLHWSWFIVAILIIQLRSGAFASPVWNVLEYLALFLIVLMHEFGHQLACRSVGGKTHDIILFPLGGVAYVNPPQRPGAQLWSIAAGPLVNVLLIPVLTGLLLLLGGQPSLRGIEPNELSGFVNDVWIINLFLLIFNMLPIYPLDGGQILRSLLWFIVGRSNSLFAASIIGFVGVTGLFGVALLSGSIWLGIVAVFILMNCWGGLRQAQALGRIAKLPRRAGFACPSCKTAPPLGSLWRCGKCAGAFDMFLTQGVCPHCGNQFTGTSCLDCGTFSSLEDWRSGM